MGAPVLAIAVFFLMPGGEGGAPLAARATAAIGALMAALWMTEALPLPATSLLPIALFPIAGVATIKEASAPYANPLIYLFMGGFLIALAMEKWGLHKRIALRVILAVGTKPARLVGGFMLASAFLSMWISNTATTVMMLPIGLSVLRLVEEQERDDDGDRAPGAIASDPNFSVCLLLGLAYAASIGGVATPIGTPPNVILLGFLQDEFGLQISFSRWMFAALPISAAFLFITWLLLTRVVFPLKIKDIPGGRALIRKELAALGRMSRGEWIVLTIFVSAALTWMLRGAFVKQIWGDKPPVYMGNLTDAGVAVIAGVLLFAIPVNVKRSVFVLDWETAKKLPWGVLLLFGGGLSLAAAVGSSGLDDWIGAQVAGASSLSGVFIIALVTTIVIFLTELTSNTATATTFLPILAGAAVGLRVAPLTLLVPAAIAASFAFMMPVATPPNAIVFGSGHVRIGQMVKAGVILNIIGIAIITLAVYTSVAWALGSIAPGAGVGAP